ncbi:MAG: YraN family protein [Magnetovibrio sp.]|nr:YraN family protein [Magnetovibrio sp.]
MSKPPDRSGRKARRKTGRKARQQAQRRGRWAETLSALYLRLTGHRVLARNYKTPVGEIDLIAKRAGVVSFIEVKARANIAQACDAITAKQRARIQRAAELFLIQNPSLQRCDVRFDVCLVTSRLRLRLLRDAWRP